MSGQGDGSLDLRAVPFFARVSEEAIREIQKGLRTERYRHGQVLCTPRCPGEALSVVRSGRLKVFAGEALCGDAAELGPGGWFGASTVLLGPPDRQTVVVAEDAELVEIPRACIDRLLHTSLRRDLGLAAEDRAASDCRAGGGADPGPACIEEPSRSAVRSRPRIGLALGGGGAKAFAHLGALKVLRSAEIPIDLLAGTSAGAIVAAMFGAGKSIGEMFEFADQLRRLVLRRDGMWDLLEPPTVGLIRGERTHTLYQGILHGVTFEHLTRPLTVPSADLVAGELVVLRTGSVSDAVRASAGIPGLYAPWPHAGRYLVEGSLVKPLPVDLLREQAADLVIASQVVASPAALRVAPPNVPAPHLLDLITARANAILDRYVGRVFPEAEVLIRPEVDDYDVLDYPMAEELIALGEKAAEAQLPRIRRLLGRVWSPQLVAPASVPAGAPARHPHA